MSDIGSAAYTHILEALDIGSTTCIHMQTYAEKLSEVVNNVKLRLTKWFGSEPMNFRN